MRRIIVFTSLAVLALSVIAAAADWPRFMGPSGNGTSPERGINKKWNENPPKMLWQTPMNDGGYAGPAIASGRVFIVDHKDDKDIVRSIDIKTGKDVWAYSYADAENGNWGFSRCTPAVDSGKVYTQSRMGIVNCLDAKTGALVWSRNILEEFNGKKPVWNYAMSPLIDGNRLITVPGGENASVVALDKKTGKTIWLSGSDAPGYCTPQKVTINGTPQYLIYSANYLSGLNPADGKQLWSYAWVTKNGVNAAAPIVMNNNIFISASYNHGSALVEVTPEGANTKYEKKDFLAHFSSPLLINGNIYGPGDPGFLTCIDPQTGNTNWKQEGFEKGPVIYIDGVLLAFDGKDGDLVMVDPSPTAYMELGRFKPLGGKSWTQPAASNGKLIVRNEKSLACFDLK